MSLADRFQDLRTRLRFFFKEDQIRVDVIDFKPSVAEPREPDRILDRAARSQDEAFDPEIEKVKFTRKATRSVLPPRDDGDDTP